MNFKRNIDPKEAVSIGIKETLPELTKKYKELVSYILKSKNWGSKDLEIIKDQLWRFRPQRYITRTGWANLDTIFANLEPDEYIVIYNIVYKWYKKYLNEF